jgi:hypothetical protein
VSIAYEEAIVTLLVHSHVCIAKKIIQANVVQIGETEKSEIARFGFSEFPCHSVNCECEHAVLDASVDNRSRVVTIS